MLRLQKNADAMGSTYSVELYGYDRVAMEAAADAALDEAGDLDDLLSNYKPESQWSEVNQHAAERPVKVSAELFALLSACLEYSRESEGAFDISVGPLMKVWGFYKGTGHLPHRAEVAAALTKVGYRHVHLDAAAPKRCVSTGPAWNLDPGGIGKGYAVDRMVDVLRQKGVTAALVAGSAAVFMGSGRRPMNLAAGAWRSRIPRHPSQTVDGSFFEGYVVIDLRQLREVFQRGRQACTRISWTRARDIRRRAVSAVSVVAPRTIDSEAWAKPYFVNGRQWAVKHKPKEFRVFFCEDRTEQPCAWLP